MKAFLEFHVKDRESFAEFIELLHADFQRNSEQCENKTLGEFLEAMSRYAEDIQGYHDNTKQPVNADEASWTLFADIFKGSTMYE
ncbi:MAG: hypothetical protein ACJ75B_22490 [Flavisolibacter sp.]